MKYIENIKSVTDKLNLVSKDIENTIRGMLDNYYYENYIMDNVNIIVVDVRQIVNIIRYVVPDKSLISDEQLLLFAKELLESIIVTGFNKTTLFVVIYNKLCDRYNNLKSTLCLNFSNMLTDLLIMNKDLILPNNITEHIETDSFITPLTWINNYELLVLVFKIRKRILNGSNSIQG